MQFVGVVLHHSACPSINGKGFDYYVTKDGMIVPGSEPTAPDRIHVCVEGDYGAEAELLPAEQLFMLQKLLLKLSELHGFESSELQPHNAACPGMRFPWHELVISFQDGYH